ncbi:MAG: hypothetical protein JW384_03432 [Nitrosomonadaceae bacterium]|nr:hypothetical protein [Nitrosomonadaceae bacterium]
MPAFHRLCLLIFLVSFVGCSGDSPTSLTVSKLSDAEVAATKALLAAGATVKTNAAGSVTDIDLHQLMLTAETLDFLPDLISLRVLNLADSSFNDQSLPVLERVSPLLTQLDLRGCGLSDKAPKVIARFTGLRVLRLNGKDGDTSISDDGVKALAACKSLIVLALDDLFVGSDGLAALTGLTNLEELYVAGTIIDDHSCQLIADIPLLKKLRLARNQVTDDALATLSACSSLEELDLSEDSKITDAGMAHLAKLVQLIKLNLWRVLISDEGALALAPLTKLEWLNLDNTKLSDTGMPLLQQMTALTFLHLGSTQITAASAPALFHLKSLKDLKITRTALAASDAAVAELHKFLPDADIQTEYVDAP